jgi:hypothetical protein
LAPVASLKVRGAVKEVLPLVEPPSAVTGAMHAQLLHAAAQRRPERGRVISLFRSIASHPGYAAAASVLVIGGAVTWQLSRGTLLVDKSAMMAPSPENTAESKVAEAKPVPPPAAPLGPPGATTPAKEHAGGAAGASPAAATEGEAQAEQGAPNKAAHARGYVADDKAPLEKAYKSGSGLSGLLGSKGERPAAGGKHDGDGVLAELTPVGKGGPPDVYLNAGPDQRGRLRVEREAKTTVPTDPEAQDERHDFGKVVARGDSNAASSAVGGTAAGGGAHSAPARRAEPQAVKQMASPPEKPQAASQRMAALPQAATDAPAQPAEEGLVVAAPAKEQAKDAQARDAQTLMQRANELADAGKCEDAKKLYSVLEHRFPALWSPAVGIRIAKCLREQDRLDEEQNILDQIKRQKMPVNVDLANEQRLLDERRAQRGVSSGGGAATRAKAKKASKTVDSEAPSSADTAIKRAY